MQPGGSQASWRTGPAPSHIGVVGTRRRHAHAGGHGLSKDTGPVRASGFSGELLTRNTSPTESHGQAPGKPELPYGGNRRDVVGGACGVLGYRPPFRATGVIGDPHVPVPAQGHIRRIIDVCVAIADGGDELGAAVGPDGGVCGHRVTGVVADPHMPGRVHG